MSITYIHNRCLHLLGLTRLRCLALGLDPRKFVLIRHDALLQLRDIISRQPVFTIEEVAQSNHAIANALQIFKNALIPRSALVFQQALAIAQVLRRGFDAFVQERHVVDIDGESVVCRLRDRCQVHTETTVFGRNGFLALAQSLDQITEVDVQVGRATHAGPHGLKGLLQVLGKGVLEGGRQRSADELLLYRDGGLFAPNGKFLRRFWLAIDLLELGVLVGVLLP